MVVAPCLCDYALLRLGRGTAARSTIVRSVRSQDEQNYAYYTRYMCTASYDIENNPWQIKQSNQKPYSNAPFLCELRLLRTALPAFPRECEPMMFVGRRLCDGAFPLPFPKLGVLAPLALRLPCPVTALPRDPRAVAANPLFWLSSFAQRR
jgi:hypothetical protein